VVNRNATSPWPFVGMAGMACAFFLYAASGLVAPWWGVTLLLLLWLVMFVIGCTWWTPHPKRLLVLPVVAVALWFGLITLGAVLFDWTA
jgi:prepilin signal peptidase PulO-like enzyme (type II secretory pathway)